MRVSGNTTQLAATLSLSVAFSRMQGVNLQHAVGLNVSRVGRSHCVNGSRDLDLDEGAIMPRLPFAVCLRGGTLLVVTVPLCSGFVYL